MPDNFIVWPILIFLPIMSTVLIVAGSKKLCRNLRSCRSVHTVKTTGIIVDIAESYADSPLAFSAPPTAFDFMFYVPTVAYRDEDVVYKITGEARRSLKRSIAIGKEVPVIYSKQNPQDAVIASFYEMWAYPVLRLVIGLILLLPAYGAIRIMLTHLHF